MYNQVEANKALVRRFFAAIEEADFDVFDEIVAERYDDHLPGQSPGRDVLKRYFAGLHAAMSDIRLPILQIVAEGDRVAVFNAIRGIHSGDFAGIAPTGRPIDVNAFQLYRIENGQLAEHWEVADFASLIQQLQPAAAA